MSTKPGAGWSSPAIFQLGKEGDTLAIPMEIHAVAREKVVEQFGLKSIKEGVLLLKGGEDRPQYDTDMEHLFNQESFFKYLFGVKEAGFYGAISLSTGKSVLFIPKLDPTYSLWCGEIHPPSYFQAGYGVDEVYFVEELSGWLEKELAVSPTAQLHIMSGINMNSGRSPAPTTFKGDEAFADKLNTEVAYNILVYCRITKSRREIEVMEYCCWVASNAHVAVMRHSKECQFEFELEAKFLYEIYRHGGCRRVAYTSICACGPNAAVLHYGHAAAPNERRLYPTDIALLDMGAEYHGYASDITCSFPLDPSGKFSADQKVIYEAVLNAQRVVYGMMKPGTLWADCRAAAEREIVQALMNIGVLHNGTMEEIIAADVGRVFFPHGLGHLIGLDTHDVGGFRPTRPPPYDLNKVLTSTHLEEGMVVTNEPGCYFSNPLLNEAVADPKRSPFINTEVLDRFRSFGGVRIEDVVVITKDGPVNITLCPRTVEEVESVLAGASWPPAWDRAPELCRKWAKLAPKGRGMIPDWTVQVCPKEPDSNRCCCSDACCVSNCQRGECKCGACKCNVKKGCTCEVCNCVDCKCGTAGESSSSCCSKPPAASSCCGGSKACSNTSCSCGADCKCGDTCQCGTKKGCTCEVCNCVDCKCATAGESSSCCSKPAAASSCCGGSKACTNASCTCGADCQCGDTCKCGTKKGCTCEVCNCVDCKCGTGSEPNTGSCCGTGCSNASCTCGGDCQCGENCTCGK